MQHRDDRTNRRRESCAPASGRKTSLSPEKASKDVEHHVSQQDYVFKTAKWILRNKVICCMKQ